MAVALGDGNLTGLPFALVAFAVLAYGWARGGAARGWMLPVVIASTAAIACGYNSPERSLLGLVLPLTLAQALVGLALVARPRLAVGPLLAAAIALYAIAGAVTIAAAPVPYIDVLELQQQGAVDLEHGRDPYAAAFANRYTPAETRVFFGDDRVALREYPYPPLSLLATTLAHRLTGDVRWILLAAQLGIGVLLFALARGHGGDGSTALGIATLHFLHPRGLFILGRGWTDAMLACAFLAVIWLVQSARVRWLGAALGAFVALKQYSVLALPLFARHGGVPRRSWIEALAVAAAVTVPFFVWSPADFVNDVVLFQVRQPFRADAMSIPALLFALTGWRAPGAVAVVGAAVALAALWKKSGPGEPWRLPMAVALVYMAFFLCAKQAFCNYYYFAGSVILSGAALGA